MRRAIFLLDILVGIAVCACGVYPIPQTTFFKIITAIIRFKETAAKNRYLVPVYQRLRCDFIVAGATGAGGEVGHMTVPYHPDWECCCGRKGCLEVTSSATGIIRAAKQFSPFKEMDKVTAKDVYDAAAAGDENAQAVVKEAGSALGYAAAVVSCVVNPEIILLGGGVSAAGSALLGPVEAAFKANALSACAGVRFALAQLGNNAGIYGGAALFFTE